MPSGLTPPIAADPALLLIAVTFGVDYLWLAAPKR